MKSPSTPRTYDVIGIGFGPANIALAIAFEELNVPLSLRFLEKRAGPGWQEGMLLPESDIQNHPLRDLVTPRNPRSRYTFTNFLFENNRLFEHLNLPLPHPLRLEYNQYIKWVAGHFAHQVEYGCSVTALTPVLDPATGRLTSYRIQDARGDEWFARSIVLAPGRTPNIPEPFSALSDSRIVHLNDFLPALERATANQRRPRVGVIGGSQTAVELLLHLAGQGCCQRILGVNRNFGFRLKDTSPFSDEVYFPKFVDTFFHASDAVKNRLRQELVFTNYSASDRDVLDALYVLLYRNRILGRDDVAVLHNTEVQSVSASSSGVRLALRSTLDGSLSHEELDLLVLATGFKDLGTGPQREPFPALLANLAPHLDLRNGAIRVEYDYRVGFQSPPDQGAPLFLNGLCESSHGMGDAGSFSLLSLRSAAITQGLSTSLLQARAA
jgi:L-ornithine N5-oxygenase